MEKRAILLRDMLSLKDPFMTSLLNQDFFIKEARKTLVGFFEKFKEVKVPDNLEKILTATRKKDQVSLLKGVSLTSETLMSLILKSYKDYGYLYSRSLFENLPNGVEGKKLPPLFQLREDGSIEKVGDTNLSDGELKNIILHRKVIVSNFFEKGDVWHCFFITYESIAGNESWKDGQTHLHYISSAFGITKNDFIESTRTGQYRSTPVHIDLLDYGSQGKISV